MRGKEMRNGAVAGPSPPHPAPAHPSAANLGSLLPSPPPSSLHLGTYRARRVCSLSLTEPCLSLQAAGYREEPHSAPSTCPTNPGTRRLTSRVASPWAAALLLFSEMNTFYCFFTKITMSIVKKNKNKKTPTAPHLLNFFLTGEGRERTSRGSGRQRQREK